MCHIKWGCPLSDSLKKVCARLFSESIQVSVVVPTTGKKKLCRRVSSQKLQKFSGIRAEWPFIEGLLDENVLIIVGEGNGGFPILEINCPN